MYTDKISSVSGQALASSDISGMSPYISSYWLYKCFSIPIPQMYITKGLFTKDKGIFE